MEFCKAKRNGTEALRAEIIQDPEQFQKKIIEKERKRSQNWLDIQDLEINYSVTSVFRIYLTESSFLQ